MKSHHISATRLETETDCGDVSYQTDTLAADTNCLQWLKKHTRNQMRGEKCFSCSLGSQEQHFLPVYQEWLDCQWEQTETIPGKHVKSWSLRLCKNSLKHWHTLVQMMPDIILKSIIINAALDSPYNLFLVLLCPIYIRTMSHAIISTCNNHLRQ